MIHYAALFAAILVSSGGQILLKLGTAGEGGFIAQLFRPATMAGLVLYGGAAGLFIYALRGIPLAVAGPTAALTYVAAALAGWLIFHETLAITQVGGIVLIFAGVALLTATGP